MISPKRSPREAVWARQVENTVTLKKEICLVAADSAMDDVTSAAFGKVSVNFMKLYVKPLHVDNELTTLSYTA